MCSKSTGFCRLFASSGSEGSGAQFLSHHNNAIHSGQLYKQVPCVLRSLWKAISFPDFAFHSLVQRIYNFQYYLPME